MSTEPTRDLLMVMSLEPTHLLLADNNSHCSIILLCDDNENVMPVGGAESNDINVSCNGWRERSLGIVDSSTPQSLHVDAMLENK